MAKHAVPKFSNSRLGISNVLSALPFNKLNFKDYLRITTERIGGLQFRGVDQSVTAQHSDAKNDL